MSAERASDGLNAADRPDAAAGPGVVSAPDADAAPLRIVETGGDAACWAAQLCPECGALTEDPAAPCWRCGRPSQASARGGSGEAD